MPTTYVLGMGNVLMGDDGFGPAVVAAFEQQFDVGPDVQLVDIGTPGLDLMPWLADTPHVILVDTVAGTQPAGTIRQFEKVDLLTHPAHVRIGPHEPGVRETLLTLELADRAPVDVTLIGVVPAVVEMGLELSAPVSRAMPAAVDCVRAALARFGHTVRPRPFAPA